MEAEMGALREENRRLRESTEQSSREVAALAERLDEVALAYKARDQSWLAELDTVGGEFEEERRKMLAEIAARDARVTASAERQAALESELAEVARQLLEEATPLPRWQPKIVPFRASHTG